MAETRQPDDVPFRTFLANLMNAVAVANPQSAEVPTLVREGQTQFGSRAAGLDAILALWQRRHGLTPETQGPRTARGPGDPPWYRLGGWLLAAALGAGGMYFYLKGMAGISGLHPSANAATALLTTLVAGLVGGLANGYLAGVTGVLPRRSADGVKVFLPGWVGSGLLGMGGAALTVGLPTALGLPQADGSMAESGSLSALVLGALAVGFGSSNAASRHRDAVLYGLAVQAGLRQDPDPEMAAAVDRVPTVPKLFEMVTGQSLSPNGEKAEADLRTLFHGESLKRHLLTVGPPKAVADPARVAGALPAGVLAAVQAAPATVRDAVADLPLADLRTPVERLRAATGLEASATEALRGIQTAAQAVATGLQRMSPNWLERAAETPEG